MKKIHWAVRFEIIKAALFGDMDEMFNNCLAFCTAVDDAMHVVELKKIKSDRKVRSDKGVKRGRVRKSGKESIRSKRIKGGKNASV